MNSTECHSVYRIHRRLIRERWIKRLRGCPNVQAFVDDTCAHSKVFDAHLDHLDQTLGRFNRAGIQLRIDKCSFGYEEVDFLGHRVSSKGRRPLPTTLSKISKFPRPRSRKEVRQFMWLVNWYRDYIPSVSDTADPLLALTNKGTEWLWTEECECSYQKLRTQLINEPQQLAFPDWRVPF